MSTFIRRWLLASAGFLALELATRPTPPRRDVLSDRAAALWIDLADLDRELRTATATPEVLVPPRSICLCDRCQAGRGAGRA